MENLPIPPDEKYLDARLQKYKLELWFLDIMKFIFRDLLTTQIPGRIPEDKLPRHEDYPLHYWKSAGDKILERK